MLVQTTIAAGAAGTAQPARPATEEHLRLLSSGGNGAASKLPGTLVPLRVQFVGHEADMQVPEDLCLLGCIFNIQDYDGKTEEENLSTWKKVIEQNGGEVEDEFSAKCTHVLCQSQKGSVVQQAMKDGKRCVTAHWLNDILEQKKLQPPWMALHFPLPHSQDKPCKNQVISVTNFEGQERAWLKQMVLAVGAKYTGYMTRQNSVLITKKEEGTKFDRARQWCISTVNVQWLHDIMFGQLDALKQTSLPKYQQYVLQNPFKVDYSLVPHLMAAWRTPVKISDELWKKFSRSPKQKEKENGKRKSLDEDDEQNKRVKSEPQLYGENIPLTTANPPSEDKKPHVLFTGVKDKPELTKIVCQLGGCIASSVRDCTHLIMTKMVRTVKLLCAINFARHIVTTEWLLKSQEANEFVDEQPYVTSDLDAEKHFGFCLNDTLARSERKALFKDFVIFITPGVFPPPSVLRDVVECGNGTVVTKKRPTNRQIQNMKNAGTRFLVISCDNDLHLCTQFLTKEIGVHNAEFIMTGTLRQELDFESFAYQCS